MLSRGFCKRDFLVAMVIKRIALFVQKIISYSEKASCLDLMWSSTLKMDTQYYRWMKVVWPKSFLLTAQCSLLLWPSKSKLTLKARYSDLVNGHIQDRLQETFKIKTPKLLKPPNPKPSPKMPKIPHQKAPFSNSDGIKSHDEEKSEGEYFSPLMENKILGRI